MRQQKNIMHIYVIWTLKISIAIYMWLNFFFDNLPGTFKFIAVVFFILEFMERFFVNLHKEIHFNNFWDYTVDNYDNFILSWLANWATFWLTFTLIVYVMVFRHGTWTGIIGGAIIYFGLLLWFTDRAAKFAFFLKTKFDEMKIFLENITSPSE